MRGRGGGSNHILHLYISALKFRKHFHILFESSQQHWEIVRTTIILLLSFFPLKKSKQVEAKIQRLLKPIMQGDNSYSRQVQIQVS